MRSKAGAWLSPALARRSLLIHLRQLLQHAACRAVKRAIAADRQLRCLVRASQLHFTAALRIAAVRGNRSHGGYGFSARLELNLYGAVAVGIRVTLHAAAASRHAQAH